MRLYILLSTFLITSISLGQPFRKDWANFKAENWIIKQVADTTPYLGKQTRGQLIFKNKFAKQLAIKYYVYKKIDIDSLFTKKIQDRMFVQSCGVLTDGKTNFISFNFGNYYYLVEVCHNCNPAIYNECNILSRQIFTYIFKEIKK